jgi:hypothetical protein
MFDVIDTEIAIVLMHFSPAAAAKSYRVERDNSNSMKLYMNLKNRPPF